MTGMVMVTGRSKNLHMQSWRRRLPNVFDAQPPAPMPCCAPMLTGPTQHDTLEQLTESYVSSPAALHEVHVRSELIAEVPGEGLALQVVAKGNAPPVDRLVNVQHRILRSELEARGPGEGHAVNEAI